MNARTPAFAAAYGTPNGIADVPLIDDTSTMLPGSPRSTSRRATACVVMNADWRLSSTTAANVAGGIPVTSDQSSKGMPPTTCTRPRSGGRPSRAVRHVVDRGGVGDVGQRRDEARGVGAARALGQRRDASRSTSRPRTVTPARRSMALTPVPMPSPPAPATTTVRPWTPSSRTSRPMATMRACSTVVPVFVTHAATQLGRDLAAALGELGRDGHLDADGFADRAAADAAFARAPAIDVVVHVCVDDAGLVPQPLADTDPAAWDARRRGAAQRHHLHVPGRPRALRAHRDAATSCWSRRPRGSPVPAASCRVDRGRGVRALGKSAARQWGPQGITVNAVLVPPGARRARAGRGDDVRGATRVGRPPDLARRRRRDDRTLRRPHRRGITGATVIVDGGSVMAP